MTLAFAIMNLDKSKTDWSKMRKELREKFKRMGEKIHPDKCTLVCAIVVSQLIQNSNRQINAYIDFKENGIGAYPFNEPS